MVTLESLNFCITLWGYGIIAFLVSNPSVSQTITIPYRAFVLAVNVFFILKNLGCFNSQLKNPFYSRISWLSKNKIFLLFIFFLILYSFRIIYETTGQSSISLPPIQYILFWFCITLLPGLGFLYLDISKCKAYLIISWISLTIIGFNILLLNPDKSDFFFQGGRFSAAALNPISLGQYASSLSLVSLFLWLKAKDIFAPRLQPILTVASIITTIIGTIGVFLSGSRGPLISLAICFLVLLFYSQKLNLKSFLRLTLFIICVSLAFSFALEKSTGFIDRLFQLNEELSSTGSARHYYSRKNLYSIAFQTIDKNLFLGFGAELPDQLGYPHNLILESFLSTGLIGGSIFVFLLIYFTVQSLLILSPKSKSSEWGWLGILFIQYLISGLFSGSIYSSSILWYLMFSIMVISNFNADTRSNTWFVQQNSY